MAWRLVCWLGVAAALAFVGQPATAGERETAAVQIHHRGPSVQSVAVVNRSEDRGLRIENGGRRQLAETGPATSPRERKSITFFRLDPKFGDVAVQPVVGGVNGAQLSVGF